MSDRPKRGLDAQFLRFSIVGALGFATDGGLLTALVAWGYSPHLSRAVSFPLAVLTTWYLNRIWTFRVRTPDGRIRQAGRYFAVQCAGAISNFVVYAAVLGVIGTSPIAVFLAFAVGSLFGLAVNFAGARQFAFR